MRGRRALDWKLVDELVPRSRLDDAVAARAAALAEGSDRPADARGIALPPLERTVTDDIVAYRHVRVALDREQGTATLTVSAPDAPPPAGPDAIHAAGADFWPLALARELEDAILHLRFNEPALGTWTLKTAGQAGHVASADAALVASADDWLVREITLYLKRTLKRLDVSARSLVALIEPGSCFTGTLLELALAADRSFMLDGTFEESNLAPATVRLTAMNTGPLPMANGLTRLASRFFGDDAALAAAHDALGADLDAAVAEALGLVTFIPDDIDWEDEVRIAVEARAAFSPDALSGMEASLRFAGPETLETKIFGRLSAWQNWIFQRPNTVGSEGALKLYGSGVQPTFDRNRV